jgi:CRISPR-associated exonuclease Cas4
MNETLDLARLLEKVIIEEQKKEQQPLVIGVYHPSLLPQCLRKQAYEYNEQRPYEEYVQRVLFNGKILHDAFAILLKNVAQTINATIESEVPLRIVHPEYRFVISGRADDVFLLKEEGREIIIEIKTTINVLEQAEKGYIPKEWHIDQLNAYLSAYPGAEGLLIYIDRNNLTCKQYPVMFSEKRLLAMFERAKMLHEWLTKGTLPPPEAKNDPKNAWQCKTCPYAKECTLNLTLKNNPNPTLKNSLEA